MYNDGDKKREFNIEEIVLNNKLTDNGRTEWRRDYARLLHAPSFRRLQGKTQLYPGNESDFFRNRLTHSLEVAQIAKSIAITINEKYKNKNIYIEPDICEFAGLAHDLGHPPFGHQGERALDECMRDFGGFEGNAQTLRILSRIEKKIKNEDRIEGKEFRHGLNLTYRALASILKYDNEIPFCKNKRKESEKNKPVKGYYATESDLVSKIKANVVGADYIGKFKTIECQIMDIADDIAYSTFDLEDGFKAGFYHPMDLLNLDNKIYENVADTLFKGNIQKPEDLQKYTENVYKIVLNIFIDLFEANTDIIESSLDIYERSKQLANDGNIRTEFTSDLINSAINSVTLFEEYNDEYPSMTKVTLSPEILLKVEVLKHLTYEFQILSPRLKVAEHRGIQIVKEIFEELVKKDGWRLLPDDYQFLYNWFKDNEPEQRRTICDFIAGMTDKYCLEFYGRLKSHSPETFFKPL